MKQTPAVAALQMQTTENTNSHFALRASISKFTAAGRATVSSAKNKDSACASTHSSHHSSSSSPSAAKAAAADGSRKASSAVAHVHHIQRFDPIQCRPDILATNFLLPTDSTVINLLTANSHLTQWPIPWAPFRLLAVSCHHMHMTLHFTLHCTLHTKACINSLA
jgi:hypothetical protein